MKGKLINLTLPLFSGAPIWSPEPKTIITDYFTLGRAYGAEEGMNMKVLYMSGHAGTHCDAPVHRRSGRPSLDEIPLERYVGRASVAHLPDKGFDDPWIAIADLEHLSDKLGEGSRLLVHTGWDRFWETDNQTYFDQQKAPKLHLETLAWLRDRKVDLIGVDMPSVNALLEQETVDAALIATPVYQHRDQAVACAQCGVHVLLEKPMARTPAECDEIIAAHKKADTILMVAFMKRFNRSHAQSGRIAGRGHHRAGDGRAPQLGLGRPRGHLFRTPMARPAGDLGRAMAGPRLAQCGSGALVGRPGCARSWPVSISPSLSWK